MILNYYWILPEPVVAEHWERLRCSVVAEVVVEVVAEVVAEFEFE